MLSSQIMSIDNISKQLLFNLVIPVFLRLLKRSVEFNEHTTMNHINIQKIDTFRSRNKISNVCIGNINGQRHRFHGVMKQCCRNINGAILVFNVDAQKSVNHMIYPP